MKNALSPRVLFALGFLVILAANIMVIFRVATNKMGAPEAAIELTQRELALPFRMHRENSGLSLELKWRTFGKDDVDYYDSRYRSPDWITKEKLQLLGFPVNKPPGSPDLGKHIVPRKAYIVLEFEGKPYQALLRRAEEKFKHAQAAIASNPDNEKIQQEFKNAKARLQQEQTSASRLFAVDAGLNAQDLRTQYPDRSRFIIAPGLVEMNWHFENKTPKPTGYVSRLLVESIHVPLELRKVFDEVLAANSSRAIQTPRYKVVLAYGARFEPWIQSAARTPFGTEK